MAKPGSFLISRFLRCLMATAAIFVILLVLDMQHIVVIASLGGTAFILFAMPSSTAAQPRHVLLGQTIGLVSGLLWSLVPHASFLAATIVFAGATGTSFLLMVLTKTEHPPAAATALGIAITGIHFNVLVTLFVSVPVLVLFHRLIRDRFPDLL